MQKTIALVASKLSFSHSAAQQTPQSRRHCKSFSTLTLLAQIVSVIAVYTSSTLISMSPVTRKRSREGKVEGRVTKRTRYSSDNPVKPSSSKRKVKGRHLSKPFAQDEPTIDPGFIHTHTKSTPLYVEISSDDDKPLGKATSTSLPQDIAGSISATSSLPISGGMFSRAMAPVESYDVCFGLVRCFLRSEHSLLPKYETDETSS